MKEKMVKKDVMFKPSQWTKAEAIRRKLDLNSKSGAVREGIDQLYEKLGLEPINAPSELNELK